MLEKIKTIFNNIKTRFTNKKWKLYIYYLNQCVKMIKVDADEKPLKKAYVLNVWFRKHIFKTNYAKVVLVPMRILYHNDITRETHVESKLYEGVDVE